LDYTDRRGKICVILFAEHVFERFIKILDEHILYLQSTRQGKDTLS
jgi:hypothetical protein